MTNTTYLMAINIFRHYCTCGWPFLILLLGGVVFRFSSAWDMISLGGLKIMLLNFKYVIKLLLNIKQTHFWLIRKQNAYINVILKFVIWKITRNAITTWFIGIFLNRKYHKVRLWGDFRQDGCRCDSTWAKGTIFNSSFWLNDKAKR